MSYKDFQKMILAFVKNAGVNGQVVFGHDSDKQLYIAEVPSEELKFSCAESGLGFSVRFRSHLYPMPTAVGA